MSDFFVFRVPKCQKIDHRIFKFWKVPENFLTFLYLLGIIWHFCNLAKSFSDIPGLPFGEIFWNFGPLLESNHNFPAFNPLPQIKATLMGSSKTQNSRSIHTLWFPKTEKCESHKLSLALWSSSMTTWRGLRLNRGAWCRGSSCKNFIPLAISTAKFKIAAWSTTF